MNETHIKLFLEKRFRFVDGFLSGKPSTLCLKEKYLFAIYLHTIRQKLFYCFHSYLKTL